MTYTNLLGQTNATYQKVTLGDLNNRKVFSHSSGDWELNIKMLEGLVSPDSSLFGLQMAIFLLCPHMVFPPCMQASGVCLCIQISSSYKDQSDWIRAHPSDLILL